MYLSVPIENLKKPPSKVPYLRTYKVPTLILPYHLSYTMTMAQPPIEHAL